LERTKNKEYKNNAPERRKTEDERPRTKTKDRSGFGYAIRLNGVSNGILFG
jgi:hypothetical protein